MTKARNYVEIHFADGSKQELREEEGLKKTASEVDPVKHSSLSM